MSRFHGDEGDGHGISFRDVVLAIAMTFALVLTILLLLPKNPELAQDEQARERGNVRVEIIWPDDYDVDIDLWGRAPGTPSVGYSNKNGVVLNLVRDDLGGYADITGINYEVMFSRGLPPGEWAFNIHWFSNVGNKIEVPVQVIVTIRYDDSSGSKSRPLQIVSNDIILSHIGQELTVIRFRLNSEGQLIDDSLTSLFVPLRSLGNNNTEGD